MNRLRQVFGDDAPDHSYEPLEGSSERPDGERIEHTGARLFSWTDYSVFLLLGVAMLWAWNMFLAAAPYFQRRFASNDNLLRNFQSGILSVSTVGNLGSMIVLTKLQARANYPKRITIALSLNAVVFTLLALSTKLFLSVSAGIYFAFLMIMALSASLATGLCQNGVFAYVSGCGREEYTQAIMTGQGVAGVLPALTQIISVLSVPKKQRHDVPQLREPNTSAFVYFMTATIVSALTLVAFFHLLSRTSSKSCLQQTHLQDPAADLSASTQSLRKTIPLMRLLGKLFWLASALFITFAVTMFFPIFTSRIISVRDPATSPRLFQPATFIPLGFFFWNVGDLIGRTGPALPALRLTHRPMLLFCFALARLSFIPLYFLCNIGGKGASVDSDFFYLVFVQALFGLSNGYLGSSCMMGFAEYVESDELEAAGGFMSLCLVSGLTAGSFLSFAVASFV
ncbi:nucleoside transporter-domain-containing protein [Ampelomyces quisqualis]|uniref:Nucleoside transporter-domain-containing protein n=1 Tax=Ampelomyces quisqualis TaxID=50730 RepID=A0A6A5QR51_AMPQU|nr:nucleoside transporter-domain-containing protein [Ampelomyces quisqualis]